MEALPRGTAFLVGLATLAVAWLALAAHADAIIIWADGGSASAPETLASAHRDGTGLNEFFVITGAIGGFNTGGVAVDANHVYWADRNGSIGRANLDGTGVEQNFITTNGGRPLGLAVNADHIFWTNAAGGTIGKARLDGTHVNQFYIFTQYNPSIGGIPSGLAVDDKYIYWSNDKTTGLSTTGSIGRATIANPNATVRQTFIPNLTTPAGIAVNGDHIYWANANRNTEVGAIGRADADGTGVNQSFIPLGTNSDPLGVTLGSSHIYWASPPAFGSSSIGRANLDGTEAQRSFIRGTEPSWGVAITPKASGAHRH